MCLLVRYSLVLLVRYSLLLMGQHFYQFGFLGDRIYEENSLLDRNRSVMFFLFNFKISLEL